MDNAPIADLLQSELVRHPVTGELFMIDRETSGEMLAFAGPLDRAQVWAGNGPRALISLGADQDWFVRHVDAAEAEDPDELDEDLPENDELGEDVIRAVLAWAAAIAWQPVGHYRRVDEFNAGPADDSDSPSEPRFVRTVYLLESLSDLPMESPGIESEAGSTAPGPPAAPPPPLWSGPGPVALG